MLGRFLDEPD